MALIWIDGFDHYGTGNLNSRLLGAYTSGSLTSVSSISSGDSLTGANLYFNYSTGDSAGAPIRNVGSLSKCGVGFHYRFNSSSYAGWGPLSFFLDDGRKIYVVINSSACGIKIGTSSTNAAPTDTFDYLAEVGVWHHVEVVADLANEVISLRVDGVPRGDIALPGLSGNTVTDVGIGFKSFSPGSTLSFRIDNLYIWDSTGSTNNDWIGERNVYTLMPDADGSQADWVPSAGSDGYAILNSIPATSDYVEALAVSDTSTFSIENLPSTDIIISGIIFAARAAKTGTSATEFSVNVLGETGVSHPLLQDEYRYFYEIEEVDPSTGEPWEPAGVDNLEIEITRTL